jgi:surface polysaccharide O-acyltransferase-like enzyme
MSRFLPYIHNLRGLAILFIVGVHARGYETDWVSHPEAHHFFLTLFDNGTILFVFIAGFLFQHLTHSQFVYPKYLEQKLKVVILPYLLISIPLIIIRIKTGFDSLALPEDFHHRPLLSQFLLLLITGSHMPPFWFIPMVFLIYLTAPLLHAADNRNFFRYIFPFLFVAGMFTYRPAHNANPLLAYVHFLPIYVTGMWASYHRERILALGRTLLFPLMVVYVGISILDLSGAIALGRKLSMEQVLQEHLLRFNIYVFKAVVLCFILLITFYLLRNRPMPWLDLLGQYSFGIYFVHFIFITISMEVSQRLQYTLDFSVITFLIYYVFIMLASVGSVFLLKKLTGNYSRYLIGS